jgi:hypothetical protein
MKVSGTSVYTVAWIKKPPKGYYNPLRGFTRSSFDNPTFSFHASEGKRFCWEVICERGIVYRSNGIKSAKFVKWIFSPSKCQDYNASEWSDTKYWGLWDRQKWRFRANVHNTPSFKLVLDMWNLSVILRKVNKHGKAAVFRWGLFVWGVGMEHYEKLNNGKFLRPLPIHDMIPHPVKLRNG